MKNRSKLIKAAGDLIRILTKDEILDEFVGDFGIETVEDWCGYDVSDDELVIWVEDTDYFVVIKKDEDLDDDQLNDLLLYMDLI